MENLIKEFEGLIKEIDSMSPDQRYKEGAQDMLRYVVGRLETEIKNTK